LVLCAVTPVLEPLMPITTGAVLSVALAVALRFRMPLLLPEGMVRGAAVTPLGRLLTPTVTGPVKLPVRVMLTFTPTLALRGKVRLEPLVAMVNPPEPPPVPPLTFKVKADVLALKPMAVAFRVKANGPVGTLEGTKMFKSPVVTLDETLSCVAVTPAGGLARSTVIAPAKPPVRVTVIGTAMVEPALTLGGVPGPATLKSCPAGGLVPVLGPPQALRIRVVSTLEIRDF
jgi:hypothetical protein